MKAGNRVYFLVNRSVPLVARNREFPKELNNVPCVVWSCIKLHVTHEIVNYVSRLIIRATSCTLRHRELRIKVNHSCNKLHATHEMGELHIEVNHSCNKLHATHEMRELHIEVNHSCNKLHATHDIMNYALKLIIHAANCTLRGRFPYASRMVFIVRLWVAIIKVRWDSEKFSKISPHFFYYLRKPPFIVGGICTMLSGDFMFDYLLGDCIKRKKSLSGLRINKLSELAKLLS